MKAAIDSTSRFVFILLISISLSFGQDAERTYLEVSRNGEFDFKVETTNWKVGEEFIKIGGYRFLWTGQEQIDYVKNPGVLEIEGHVAGVDLTPEESGELEMIVAKEMSIARRDISTAVCVKVDTVYWHLLRQVKAPLALEGGLSDRFLKRLKKHSGLRGLWAWGKGITDDGLRYLENMPKLTELSLNETSITDAGLRKLASVTGLRKLNLADNDITGQGFSELSGLHRLEHLDVSFTSFTDEGLSELKLFHNLKALNLEGTKISDAGLIHIESLSNLERLVVKNTQANFSSPEALKLRQVLPECEIVFF